MRKILLAIGCIVLLSGCCNTSNQETGGKACNCAAIKDSLEIIMNIPIKVKHEYVSAYKAAYEKCKVSSMQEEVCLEYSLFQSYTDSTEFHIFERWKNTPGHLAHKETEHYKQFRKEIEGMTVQISGRMNTYVCPCVNP